MSHSPFPLRCPCKDVDRPYTNVNTWWSMTDHPLSHTYNTFLAFVVGLGCIELLQIFTIRQLYIPTPHLSPVVSSRQNFVSETDLLSKSIPSRLQYYIMRLSTAVLFTLILTFAASMVLRLRQINATVFLPPSDYGLTCTVR